MKINSLGFIFIAFTQIQECVSFLDFRPLSIYNGHLPIRLNAATRESQPQEIKKTEFENEFGVIEPLGFWDPLKLTDNMDQRLFNYMREAELQHGRIAMLSMIILPTLDVLDKNEIAINAYNNNKDMFLSTNAFLWMGLFETARILVQYENPSKKLFRLKENVVPGNLFNYNISSVNSELINKELSNGRLAMIGAFFYIIQELLTQQKLF